MRRGLANPATSQLATGFRAGLFEVWNAVGGEVGANSAGRWSFIEINGLIEEASAPGWGVTVAKLGEWLVFGPADLAQARWGLMNNALSDATQRQSALKLWIAATV